MLCFEKDSQACSDEVRQCETKFYQPLDKTCVKTEELPVEQRGLVNDKRRLELVEKLLLT